MRRLTLGTWLLPVYAVLALIFLLTPIAYTFVFSFNDSSKLNVQWVGFTLDKWLNVCSAQGVCAAFATSITVAVVATLIATALGDDYAKDIDASYGRFLDERATVVTVRTPLPLIGLVGIDGGLEVSGHAAVEELH